MVYLIDFYFHRRANRSLADPERVAKKMNVSKDSEHGSPRGTCLQFMPLFMQSMDRSSTNSQVVVTYSRISLIFIFPDIQQSACEGLDDEHVGRKESEVKAERYSPWGGACDRDNSHALRAESPLGSDPRDMYSSEQLVPGQNTYQPYRYLVLTSNKTFILLCSALSLSQ